MDVDIAKIRQLLNYNTAVSAARFLAYIYAIWIRSQHINVELYNGSPESTVWEREVFRSRF